jgi:DNA-binding NtrC family response regulator
LATILVADDERSICEAFRLLLEREGHSALIAANAADALRCVREGQPDAVFLDVRMPGMDGIAVLRQIVAEQPRLPVIVMTAYGTLGTATDAIRSGAFDYLGKPLDLDQIRQLLKRALHEPSEPPGTAPETSDQRVPDPEAPALIGQSRAMQEIFKLIALVGGNDLGILVQGESGVGKELVARAIHDAGQRRRAPFVAVNCAAIPEQLMEAQMFGHERGAFTDARESRPGRFEVAAAGTLFLDEIGELPLHLQSKLLRVLQERSFERVGGHQTIAFRARLIAASNVDLIDAVANGRFREDLLYRLNPVTLRVPPLRERVEDIPALAELFVSRASRETGKSLTGLEHAAVEALQARDWPGNVRELEHVIRRAALTSRGPLMSVHDFDFELPAAESRTLHGNTLQDVLTDLDDLARRVVASGSRDGTAGAAYDTAVAAWERALVRAALEATGGNQVAAARILGMHRSTLRTRLGRDVEGD